MVRRFPILKGMEPIMPIDPRQDLQERSEQLLRYYPRRPRVANLYRLVQELLDEIHQLHGELEHMKDRRELADIKARHIARSR